MNLIDAALRTPLSDLATFLSYVKQHLPAQVHTTIADALANDENQRKLIDAALRTPLHFLAN